MVRTFEEHIERVLNSSIKIWQNITDKFRIYYLFLMLLWLFYQKYKEN